MTVAENYLFLKGEIAGMARDCGRDPATITLVAVSKGHGVDKLQAAYEAGCRDFGENRLQEALAKIPQLPADVRWHFIGTLQKNKVRKVVGQFALIHSVDSVELARKIAQCSKELGVVSPVLLQANTSGEASKHGLPPGGWKEAFQEMVDLSGITVEGLMTMAPFVEDREVVGRCFAALRKLRDDLGGHALLPHLSMGMTHDYPLAIQEGATLLRVGTAIFGEFET